MYNYETPYNNMPNNYGQNNIEPMYNLPMDPVTFQNRFNRAIQDFSLNNPQELQEIKRHTRALERDAAKSYYRSLEFESKQKTKELIGDIYNEKTSIVMLKNNGSMSDKKNEILFNCKIDSVRRYMRVDSNEIQWQVSIIDESSKIMESELYNKKSLHSISELQRTLLGKYQNSYNQSIMSVGWKWIRNFLVNMYDSAETYILPSNAGWFISNGKCEFWTKQYENELLLNDAIKLFERDLYADLKLEDVLSELIIKCNSDQNSRFYGTLLLIRFTALLSRLATKSPRQAGVTLMGENAEDVAKNYLVCLKSEKEKVNLDSDRINLIRDKVNYFRDTPIIFSVSDATKKSTRGRLNEVMSWLDNGFIEDCRILVPFVFCLKKFSKEYPLEKAIVIEASEISGTAYKEFSELQYLLINIVLKGNEYWVEKLAEEYLRKINDSSEKEIFPIYHVITDFLIKVFSAENICTKVRQDFTDLLVAGEAEIYSQLEEQNHSLLKVFKRNTEYLVSKKIFHIQKREEPQSQNGKKNIYFDSNYYYFTKDAFKGICDHSLIDMKSILYIKQQLIGHEFVKTYNNLGSNNRELEVDFTIKDENGRSQGLSGLAIKREFWDEFGGISLYERGEINA